MFGRSGKKKPPHDAITAFLGAGAEYRGQFNFQGTARIDGGVVGDIISDGTLVLGEDGRVEGTIRVAELITNGRIVGDVQASRRVVLSKHSNLHGNLLTPAVVIEDGAVLNGSVQMTLPEEPSLPQGAGPEALAAGTGAIAAGETGN
jgi:cytoskeletal protein CcmA (bactofilin family)